MSTGLQLLQDIEVEMVKLANAYEVIATELTKQANEEAEDPYRYGQYAGAVGAGVGAGALAGGADAYRAARMQKYVNPNTIADDYWMHGKATGIRNTALKSLGKKVAIGAGIGATGAAGLAAYHSGATETAKDHAMGLYSRFRGGNEPAMVDDGQTKAASLRALLAQVR